MLPEQPAKRRRVVVYRMYSECQEDARLLYSHDLLEGIRNHLALLLARITNASGLHHRLGNLLSLQRAFMEAKSKITDAVMQLRLVLTVYYF